MLYTSLSKEAFLLNLHKNETTSSNQRFFLLDLPIHLVDASWLLYVSYGQNLVHGEGTSLSRVGPYRFCSDGNPQYDHILYPTAFEDSGALKNALVPHRGSRGMAIHMAWDVMGCTVVIWGTKMDTKQHPLCIPSHWIILVGWWKMTGSLKFHGLLEKKTDALPETNNPPLKIDPWKRRFLLETIIFRGELLVLGRVTGISFPGHLNWKQPGVAFSLLNPEIWIAWFPEQNRCPTDPSSRFTFTSFTWHLMTQFPEILLTSFTFGSFSHE